MKVVLLKDVRNMGKAGSVIEVSDGHAVNFIIPQKLGVPATAANLKQAELKKKSVDQQKAVSEELIAERMQVLAESPVEIARKANEKNHLYDAVDAEEIAAAAQLPVEAIKLEKPIKEVGEFEVPVSHGKDFGSIKVRIVAE